MAASLWDGLDDEIDQLINGSSSDDEDDGRRHGLAGRGRQWVATGLFDGAVDPEESRPAKRGKRAAAPTASGASVKGKATRGQKKAVVEDRQGKLRPSKSVAQGRPRKQGKVAEPTSSAARVVAKRVVCLNVPGGSAELPPENVVASVTPAESTSGAALEDTATHERPRSSGKRLPGIRSGSSKTIPAAVPLKEASIGTGRAVDLQRTRTFEGSDDVAALEEPLNASSRSVKRSTSQARKILLLEHRLFREAIRGRVKLTQTRRRTLRSIIDNFAALKADADKRGEIRCRLVEQWQKEDASQAQIRARPASNDGPVTESSRAVDATRTSRVGAKQANNTVQLYGYSEREWAELLALAERHRRHYIETQRSEYQPGVRAFRASQSSTAASEEQPEQASTLQSIANTPFQVDLDSLRQRLDRYYAKQNDQQKRQQNVAETHCPDLDRDDRASTAESLQPPTPLTVQEDEAADKGSDSAHKNGPVLPSLVHMPYVHPKSPYFALSAQESQAAVLPSHAGGTTRCGVQGTENSIAPRHTPAACSDDALISGQSETRPKRRSTRRMSVRATTERKEEAQKTAKGGGKRGPKPGKFLFVPRAQNAVFEDGQTAYYVCQLNQCARQQYKRVSIRTVYVRHDDHGTRRRIVAQSDEARTNQETQLDVQLAFGSRYTSLEALREHEKENHQASIEELRTRKDRLEHLIRLMGEQQGQAPGQDAKMLEQMDQFRASLETVKRQLHLDAAPDFDPDRDLTFTMVDELGTMRHRRIEKAQLESLLDRYQDAQRSQIEGRVGTAMVLGDGA